MDKSIREGECLVKKYLGDGIISSSSFENSAEIEFSGESMEFTIDALTASKIKASAEEDRSSVSAFLFTAFSILLSRYTYEEGNVIESIVDTENSSNRCSYAFIKSGINKTETSKNADLEMYNRLTGVLDHFNDEENYHNVIFDSVTMAKRMPSLKTLKFGIWIRFIETSQGINGRIEFNERLFNKNEIEKLSEHFLNILKEVTANPEIKLCEIDMLSEEEKNKILADFNDAKTKYPKDKTIYELFEEQVERTPDNIAVVYEDKKLTYRELNDMSNRLAGTLIKEGVKADSIVGIMVEPSVEMIVGIMGILKAGGAYLPISPEYPDERITYILQNSNTNILLTNSEFADRINIKIKLLKLDDMKTFENHCEYIEVNCNCSNLSYVIYTSGTTGYPKGVLIENRNVVNLAFGLYKDIYSKYGDNLKVALIASYVFDASVQQIFPALIFGHTLFIVPKDVKKDGNLLLKYFDDNLIDISDGTPVHINLLVNARAEENKKMTVKHFIIGGDVFSVKTAQDFYKKYKLNDINFTNVYGPTECCVDATLYHFNKESIQKLVNMPIGKPMRNESVYILGEKLELLPVGAVGELYITGDSVGRGYLNNENLTKEKFISNPFDNNKIMYKTGDYGRWTENGDIEFFGRKDKQVKIRGFRIELGEIENKLLNFNKNELMHKNHENKEIVQCTKCLLTSEYPNIHFNEEGVCNFCESYETYKEEADKYFEDISGFKKILEKSKKTKKSEYDCLLLYSGGKDSSYVLYRLVEMGLKVLAFTFDNGYISDTAFKNIERITTKLNVDSIICKNENMDKIFLESLNSDYTVCTGCFKALTAISTKIAFEKRINLIVTGLSRGQIFDTKLQGIYEQGIFKVEEIEKKLLMMRKMYHLVQDKTAELLNVDLKEEELFDETYFVDFYRYENISAHDIKEYLKKKDEFWNLPGDTGFCSTNCLINDVGIYVHYNIKRYHNYAAPLSWDCRIGQLSREAGLLELDPVIDEEKVQAILNKIGYNSSKDKNRSISKAVVLDMEDENSNKYLCAYFVSDEKITISELREYLSDKLPEYMIPSYFVRVNDIPVTINGKIDKKALAKEKNILRDSIEYIEPRNEIEKTLQRIWQGVLGIEKISMNENFFELGGHSLSAMSLLAQISKQLNVEVPLKELFDLPTIEKLSKFIEGAEEIVYSKIERIEEKEYYETSSAQKRMFTLNQLSKGEINYNIPFVMILEGKLERDRVEECFRKLIQRHEAYRTSFELVDGEIMQRIHKEVPFKVEFEEINTDTEEIIKAEAEKFIKPFDLSKAPLLRVRLIKLREEKHVLMLDIHHIITDGTSMSIITEEFTKLYKGESLEELRVQYKDYSAWENKMMASDAIKKQEEYWTKILSGDLPVLNLPTDYPRPSIQSFEGETIGFTLDSDVTEKLKKICKSSGATLYMALLSAYNILLSKYTGQEDIIIGAVTAGRSHIDLQNMVGMFVNTLAMRNYPEGNKTFNEFLQEVKKNTLAAFENQDYQFEKLVEKKDISRDLSRGALLDTVFVLQNTAPMEIELENIRIREYEYRVKVSKFDITLEAVEKEKEIKFNLEYCTRLFKRETIEEMIKHFKNILKEAAENSGLKLCEIDMLSEEEKREILVDFNNTAAEYPRDKTIGELFEEQVKRIPDDIALVYENRKLTYRELNEKANSLARSLRQKGVAADSIVGIMLESSLEMIIGILGILKAGGAYLPIDTGYPKDRIKYMLEDSKAGILLTENKFASEVFYEGDIINLNDERAYNENKENLEKINGAEGLAYIIYTSGTTGKPKGVAVMQRNVVRLIKNTNYVEFKEGDRILQTGSLGFDTSSFQIWGALLNGLSLFLTSKDVTLNAERMGEFLSANKITMLMLATPLFHKLCEKAPEIFKGLRCLLIGGDVVSPKYVNLVRKSAPELIVVDAYGPTENATLSACCVIKEELDENKTIPIGIPIANSTAYILDKYNKAVPIGVYGELCVGGDGLARGYLNNEKLTAEKFVENPYKAGQRMYHTGDLVRWLPGGKIELLGRIDHQVKIRGFRIELGEVESCLLKIKGVNEAVVIDREEEGNKYLCAYLVMESELSAGKLREELKKSLPDYMIPSYFITLTEMPLNQTGKIDRKALPLPDGNIVTGVEYISPRNATEGKLVQIWNEVLGVNRMGIDDDFFTLGGHSLKAIKMAAIIQRELEVSIAVSEIFRNPTVRSLGEYIGKTKESAYRSIEPVEERELYEVSSAQKRMFALNQFSKEETNYNVSYAMILEGKVERNRIEDSFKKLVQRHEAFRTSFELADDKIMQRIHKDAELNVEYEEISRDSDEMIRFEVKKFIKPFDLSKAPLLRVKLIRINKEKYVLMFDMHHIISDGTSMSIIMDEFTRLYKGESLEELRIQYKDYSAWENKMLDSDFMKKHEEYWVNIFRDEIPVLNLPTDYQRPSVQSFEGENIGFALNKDLTQKVKKVSKANGATLYMSLLSAYNILLSKYSGQDDIVVGSPIAGRSHIDLYNMVGIFINTLAMRNYPAGNKSFNEFLQGVKKNALNAYENQDYQFDKLVEKLNIKRDLRRNAVFDTMFIMQNTENKEIQLDNIKIKQFQFERGVSKFDITLSAEEKGEEIKFDLEYCTKLFKRETIERMISHFKNILNEVTENPEIKLCEIDMLSEEEKRKILIDFNNTETEYPKGKTICEAFEEQVKKTPYNIAVVYQDKKLTYRELNEKSNQLARVLRDRGVKADTIVGMIVDRSLEMLIGIMGILKAGGAYLPISPGYPDDRIKYMLEDSKTTILLTQKSILHTINFDGTVIDLEDRQLYQGDNTDLKIISSSKSLAYVIYTSGSTGKPKGVLIQHGSVINLVTGLRKIIYSKYTGVLNVALIAQYVFDASVKQIFASILSGNSLYIIPEEYRTIGEKLIEYYIDNSIDISDGTPSHIKLMLSDNREKIKDIPVKHFIIGGEELIVNLAKEFLSLFKDRKPDITNIYGPTECCVDSTAFLIDSNNLTKLNAVPIGRPIVNCRAYVLDKYDKLQPAGIVGELCISGDGLARGYLNNPQLTEEKFASNPFESGKKMYKTGDLVRWLPNGNIEFLGRIDHQVKIRGYRIEIGEIEALIKSHPSVKDSVVIVREDSTGEKTLIAYVVSRTSGDEKYSEGNLKEYLKKKLPKYMVPAIFVQLQKIPLNTNGKVDRFALPEPDMLQRDSDESFIAPRNKEEIKMAQIWSKVLGIEKIGIDDDFFDLGGDSFRAIKLVRSISSNLGVMELFKNSTIRELTAYLLKGVSNERTMLHQLTKASDEKNKVVSLICFPYGGGSAISFQPLANALPKNYSLYSVELPGHDYSCPDEELVPIEESAARCFEEIKQNVKGPVVLYGHCLGATMAALLAYKLEEAGIKVDGVIVGAMFPTPRISNKFFDIWEKIFPSQLTDKGNRDMLKTIGGLNSDMSPGETEFILRNLKHDARECTRWYTQIYNNKENKKFKAPITCIIGEGDRATQFYQERYKEWERFSGKVDLRTIKDAGHFFFKNQTAELIDIIKEKVDSWQGGTSAVPEARKVHEAPAKGKVVPSTKLFLIVAIVQIISEIGTILSTFGTGIWVYRQTGALSQFAMMFLLGVLPTIFTLPISGAIVDRVDRRLILIASDILSSICTLSLLILLCNNSIQMWHIYVFTIVASVATSFRQPAYLAAITQITPKIYLTQANSVSQFSTAIGGILASICGGIFMDSIGFKGLVAIDFATFIISLTTLLLIKFPDTMFVRLEEPIMKELAGGWNFIIKRKSLVAMVIFFLIVNFLASIFDVIITPLILSFTNSTALGVINAFSGIGVLCASIIMLITGGIRKRAKGMVGFVIPVGISMIIASLRPLPAFAAIALWGVGFSVTLVNIHWQSLIQVKVGLELQGRVFAINQMMVSVLRPVSYITAGILADKIFASAMKYNIFNSAVVRSVLGIGAGRPMRLVILIAGAVLFIWSILGFIYKPLSGMDDILEDAIPGGIIIKDKDKLQEMADRRLQLNLYSQEAAETKDI